MAEDIQGVSMKLEKWISIDCTWEMFHSKIHQIKHPLQAVPMSVDIPHVLLTVNQSANRKHAIIFIDVTNFSENHYQQPF
jgi:hypothetical protein